MDPKCRIVWTPLCSAIATTSKRREGWKSLGRPVVHLAGHNQNTLKRGPKARASKNITGFLNSGCGYKRKGSHNLLGISQWQPLVHLC